MTTSRYVPSLRVIHYIRDSESFVVRTFQTSHLGEPVAVSHQPLKNAGSSLLMGNPSFFEYVLGHVL